MERRIASLALLVPDYDEAIAYFTQVLGFALVQDTPRPGGERWVVVTPGDGAQTCIRLVRTRDDADARIIGRQAGARVFLVLNTDDLARDHAALSARGVVFLEAPRSEPYGHVAVFADRFGNRWDLIQPA